MSASANTEKAFERDAKDTYKDLTAKASAILGVLGGGEASLTETYVRSWSPMDGALPPHCPFVDRWASRFRGASEQIEIMCELPHWSETERLRSSVTLYAKVGSTAIWIRGHAEDQDPLRELTLEAPAQLREELEAILGP